MGWVLSSEEEMRLLNPSSGQSSSNQSQTVGTFVRVALHTGMRSGEFRALTWEVDFDRPAVTVGKAETASNTGRQILLNAELFDLLSAHADWFTLRRDEARTLSVPLGASQRPAIPLSPSPTLPVHGMRFGVEQGFAVACAI